MNSSTGSIAALRTSSRRNLRVRPLAACLVLPLAVADLACSSALAATLPVANCNDAGAGSLRAALALAHDADRVDLTALSCAKISITTGTLRVNVDNLTLDGPGANALTIAGPQVPHHYPVIGHSGKGTLQVSALQVTDNHAVYDFFVSSCIATEGTLHLDRSIVTECSQGGVSAHGLLARDSTISNSSYGISVWSRASEPPANVSIYDSTISGNHYPSGSAGRCTGMSLGSSGRIGAVLIRNTTISGNETGSVPGYAGSGAAGCIFATNVTISNSTVAFNLAKNAQDGQVVSGGLSIAAPQVTIESSLFAHNDGSDLVLSEGQAGGPVTVDGRKNLIMAAAGAVPPDTIRTDPQLLPLADNGGPTRTHALMPGSPAIDAGSNPVGLATDQRGEPFARVVGTAPDIGAFEARPPAVNIDAGFTGSWFDPAQSGHGLMLEVLPDKRLLALWFAFNPEGTQQSWFGGVGTYSGDTALISDVALPTGGSWIPDFDPGKIVRNPWGNLTFTFTDHDHGKISFNSTLGYESGSMNLLRLTNVAKQTALRPIGSPGAVTADTSGNVYFSSSPDLIFKLDPQGMLQRIAGTGTPGYSGDGGPATQAQLNFPLSYPELVADPANFSPLVGGLAVDTAGRVYVADAYNNRVRRIDTNGIISTVAGTGAAGASGDGGPATTAQIHWPQGVAVDSAGSLYFSTAFASLRKVTPAGMISTLAGDNCGTGYRGPGLCLPEQIAVDSAHNVFVPDSYCRVREVRSDGSILTFAGADNVPSNGLAFTCGYSGDGGPATKAALNVPYAVAVDNAGNLYIADSANHCIRKVNAAGTISTVAGVCDSLHGGFSGDGGPATGARLNLPLGVALDGAGNLLIADTGNRRIRKVSNGTISTIAGSGAALNSSSADLTTSINAGGSSLFSLGTGNTGGTGGQAGSETLASTATIDASFTGSWFDPAQSGHGLMLEVLPDQRLLALWFAFTPTGNQQSWFGGVGTYSGNAATINDVALPTGGSWIPNFDPATIVRNPWGTLKFTFTDCDHGKVEFNSNDGYGTGSMNLLRLTMPAGLSCP